MIDPFGRSIDYLRVSVTDRCNLRCRYCVPAEGLRLLPQDAILRYEEIAEVVRVAVGLGVTRVRLTGGEPLVRREIDVLVAMLSAIEGIADLSMTTNGIRLTQYAEKLAAAGLERVNISLDTLDPTRFAALTRGGDVRRVVAGIEAAQRAGLTPIKLNSVRGEGASAEEVAALEAFAERRGLLLRWIPEMDLAAGVFSAVEGGSGGDCRRCSRLRLSADGHLRPCLFSDVAYSVRTWGAEAALCRAVGAKPASGSACTTHAMHAIGG